MNSDNLVKNYKNKLPVVSEEKRIEIIKSVKSVDKVYLTETLDKTELYFSLNFKKIFIGSDWKNNDRWQQTKIDLSQLGVQTVFLPYTQGISSTLLRDKIQ